MKNCIFVLALFLGFTAFGANYCVGPSATGSGSGADWNNLKPWTATPARGDTWYLRGGAYAPKTFGVAESGTTLITIKKASATDHVTDAGWQAAYGTDQASWTSTSGETLITFNAGFYVFDGGYRNENNWFDGAAYGFAITNKKWGTMIQYSGGFSNVTVRYVHTFGGLMTSSTPSVSGFHFNSNAQPYNWYLTISRCYCEAGYDSFEFQSAPQAIIEYCAIWGGQGSANNHGNVIDLFYSQWGSTVRYCNVRDSYNGGYPGSLSGGASSPFSYSYASSSSGLTEVYGNIIDGYGGFGIETCPAGSAWGSGGYGKNVRIYNNTIVTRPGDTSYGAISLDWQNTSGNQIYNNLIVSTSSSGQSIAGVADTQNNVATSDTSIFVNYAARDLRLARSVGAGKSLAGPYNKDMSGNVRGADGTWDIGAYENGGTTNPVIQVSPNALSFGPLAAGANVTNTFTVQNVGAGTLSGTASIAGSGTNFLRVLSGGAYSLGAGQSQLVTVLYSQSTNGTDTGSIICTGGGGTQVSVTGLLLSLMPGLSFPSYAGAITAPFTTNGGYLSQTVEAADVNSGGQAVYAFNLTSGGSYTVSAIVNAPDGASDSFWVNMDALPTDPAMIWDISPDTVGFETRTVSWRGSGSYTNAQYNPQVFNLSPGLHRLIIVGREANVQLGQVTISSYGSRPSPPSPPQNLRIVSVQ